MKSGMKPLWGLAAVLGIALTGLSCSQALPVQSSHTLSAVAGQQHLCLLSQIRGAETGCQRAQQGARSWALPFPQPGSKLPALLSLHTSMPKIFLGKGQLFEVRTVETCACPKLGS